MRVFVKTVTVITTITDTQLTALENAYNDLSEDVKSDFDDDFEYFVQVSLDENEVTHEFNVENVETSQTEVEIT